MITKMRVDNRGMNKNIPETIEQIRQISLNDNFAINDFLDLDNLINNTRKRIEAGNVEIWTGEIKFMLWNATGLLPNLDRVIRRMESEEILFCFVTETWLNPKNSIPSVCRESSAVCTIMPRDYNRGKNGVSLIINPKMSRHAALKDLEILAKDTLNGTFIYLQVGNVKILCIYYPPSCATEIDIWMEEIFLKCNITVTSNLIILGDFNARLNEWGDHQCNANGKLVANFMEAAGLHRWDTGGQPTFIKSMNRPQDGWSIIDHVFSNTEIVDCQVVSPFNASAGHRPIVGKFLICADTKNAPPKYKRIILENLKHDDIKEQWFGRLESVSYRNLIELRNMKQGIVQEMSSNIKQQRIDKLETLIVESWMSAAREVIGEKTAGKQRIKYEPLLSPNLEALETAIIWETDEDRLRVLLQKAEKEKSKLRKERYDTFADKVNESPASEVMKIMSSMLCNRQKQQLALNSSAAALEEYKKHFELMNKNSLPQINTVVEPLIHRETEPDPIEMLTHFEPYVVNNVLKRAEWNKSPGISGLTYDCYKSY